MTLTPAPPRRVQPGVVLERVAIGVTSLLLSFGAIALMSGFFAGRDQAGVSGTGPAPGQAFRDMGDAHLTAGLVRPLYDSTPPTSGPHLVAPVTADRATLSDDQLLTALERGNVVILYGSPAPPPGVAALGRSLAGRFTPALAAAGQAVILARRPGTVGLVGLAWAHLVRVSAANDQLLGYFAQYWLGRLTHSGG